MGIRHGRLYKDKDVGHITDIRDMLYRTCDVHKDNVAFLAKDKRGEWQDIKYSKLLEDVKALGTALMDLGLKGKKVALIGENRYDWSVSYLATICGVGVIVPLDSELKEYEIENCLRSADVSAVIYSDKLDGKMQGIKQKFPDIAQYITMEKGSIAGETTKTGSDKGELSVEQLIQRGKKLIEQGDTSYEDVEINREALAALLFTSGTSANSKAVMLSHKNIAFDVEQMTRQVRFTALDRFFSVLPIHHSFAGTCDFLMPLYKGASVAYAGLRGLVDGSLQKVKPTVMLCVPEIVETLYKEIWKGIGKEGKADTVKKMIKLTNVLGKPGMYLKKKLFAAVHENFGGRLRLLISGAGPLNPEAAEGLRDLGLDAIQGYGATEASPVISVNRPGVAYKDASLGLPLPETEMDIYNPDDTGLRRNYN